MAKRPTLSLNPSPRMTSSSGIFAKRGDPWMSAADRRKDYPTSQSTPPPLLKSFHESVEESQRNAKLDKALATIGMRQDFGSPRVGLVVDPDADRWTKASKAKTRRERGPDKPIQEKSEEISTARRLANICRAMNRDLPSGRVVKIKETHKPHPNTHPAYSNKKETLGEIVQVPYPRSTTSELKRMPLNHRIRSMKREA